MLLSLIVELTLASRQSEGTAADIRKVWMGSEECLSQKALFISEGLHRIPYGQWQGPRLELVLTKTLWSGPQTQMRLLTKCGERKLKSRVSSGKKSMDMQLPTGATNTLHR